jgi:RND superfamily putative drug exporter
MVLIFQDGHLAGPLGFTAYGGITPWLPLFMFVLLFGLVGASARDAVTGGIARTAGVVTSTAVIMVAVFSIFATLSMIEFKMFGVATAVAVLIDATIVRGVLLPAGLALLGDRTFGSRRGRRTYGETASETVSEPPRPTNGWSRTRATAESMSSARSTE